MLETNLFLFYWFLNASIEVVQKEFIDILFSHGFNEQSKSKLWKADTVF